MANEKYDIQKMIDENVGKQIKTATSMITQTYDIISKQLDLIVKKQDEMNKNIVENSTSNTKAIIEIEHLKNNKDDLYIKHVTTNKRIDDNDEDITTLKTGISTLRWAGSALAGIILLAIAIIEFLQK